MLDDLFAERLASGELMPIGGEGNHLLVETSYFNPPVGMDAIIDRIMSAGYFPLLAHPERYIYMDAARYRQLHERGAKFQINLPSLLGRYGSDAAAKPAGFSTRATATSQAPTSIAPPCSTCSVPAASPANT